MILNFIYSFFATIGFAVLFNIPRKEMIYAGFCGATGWLVYTILKDLDVTIVFSTFIGALIVGILAELFAIGRKKPATVFIIPGIIPFVPGYGLYYSMLKIIEQNYEEATNVGFETLIVAVVIASAIIVSTTIGKLIRKKTLILETKKS